MNDTGRSLSKKRHDKMRRVLESRQTDLRVFLDKVHKPHNVSAIVRTSDAVGVHNVHAVLAEGRYRCHPDFAAGNHRWVKVHVHQNVHEPLAELREQGHQILAAHLSDRAVDFRTVDYTKPTVIVMGAEKDGISEDVAGLVDQHIVIPMLGLGQSLNVSVAAAIILFEAQRQRQIANCYERVMLDEEYRKRTIFEWVQPKLARYCRLKKRSYPEIDEDGDVINFKP